jgi:hypothetical protein
MTNAMTISRENFKEWQQALLNGCLSAEQEELLMQFLEENCDLIEMDDEDAMPHLMPDSLTFANKELLMRHPQNVDGLSDFDFLAIKQMEEGLSAGEQHQLSQIIDNKPNLQHDLNLYHQTKLQVPHNLTFSNKQQLKHHIIPVAAITSVLRYSAAAAIIAGAMWWLWPSANNLKPSANLAMTSIEATKDSTIHSITKPQNIDSIEVEQHKNVPTPKQHESNDHGITDPLIEPSEQMLASITPKNSMGVIETEQLNAYEIGLNVMMPQYLDNQMEMARLYAYSEPAPAPHRDNLAVRIIEGSVRVFNLFGNNEVKMDKYYDEAGNIVAYKLKGESIQWNQKVK